MPDRVRGHNRGEDVGRVDVLEDTNGSTLPKPSGKDLRSVWVAHCAAPALDDVGVRAWRSMRGGNPNVWNHLFLKEDATLSEKPVTVTPFLRFCATPSVRGCSEMNCSAIEKISAPTVL